MRISKICVVLVMALLCLNYEVLAKGRSSGGSRSSSRSRSRSSSHSNSNSGGGFWRGFKNCFGGTKSSHSSTRARSSYENDWNYNSGSSYRSGMSSYSSNLGYNSNPSYADSYLISSSLNEIPDFAKLWGKTSYNNLNVLNDDVSNHNNLNNPVSIPNSIGLMGDINNSFDLIDILDNPSLSFSDIKRNILNIVEKSTNTQHVSSTTQPSSDIGPTDDISKSFNLNDILDNPSLSFSDIRRNILNIVEKSSNTQHVSSTTMPFADNLLTENTTPISAVVAETVEPREETTAQTTQQTILNQSTADSTTTLNSVTPDANTIESTTTTTTASGPMEDVIAANTLPSILHVLKSSATESTTTPTSVSIVENPSETTTTHWLTEEDKAATNLPKSTSEYSTTTDSIITVASVTSGRNQSETFLQNDNISEDKVRLVNMKCRKVFQSKFNKLGYFIDSVEDICEPETLTYQDKKSEVADPNEKFEDDVRSVQMRCRKVMRSEFSGKGGYFLNSVDEICAPETLTQDDRKTEFAERPVEMMCRNVLQSEYNDRHLLIKSTKLVCKSEETKIRWAKEN